MQGSVIRIPNWNKKLELIKAAENLKGTSINITEDFPKEIQEQRNILIENMKKATSMVRKAYVLYDKLIVDGKNVTAGQLIEGSGTEERIRWI